MWLQLQFFFCFFFHSSIDGRSGCTFPARQRVRLVHFRSPSRHVKEEGSAAERLAGVRWTCLSLAERGGRAAAEKLSVLRRISLMWRDVLVRVVCRLSHASRFFGPSDFIFPWDATVSATPTSFQSWGGGNILYVKEQGKVTHWQINCSSVTNSHPQHTCFRTFCQIKSSSVIPWTSMVCFSFPRNNWNRLWLVCLPLIMLEKILISSSVLILNFLLSLSTHDLKTLADLAEELLQQTSAAFLSPSPAAWTRLWRFSFTLTLLR